MYRQYEDPWKCQDMLDKARERLEQAKLEADQNPDDDYAIERIVDLTLEVQELEDRVRFAWDDQEYDENYAHEMGYDQEWS